MHTTTGYERISVTMPKGLVTYIKEHTSNMSKYISDAIAERIAREKKEQAWKKLLAAPPSFTHIDDPVHFVEELRSGDEERMQRLDI
jgi:kynurenine formamidase